jgi:hypothetical protein
LYGVESAADKFRKNTKGRYNMKKVYAASAGLAFAVFGGVAQAATVTFDLSQPAPAATYGNEIDFTTSGITLNAHDGSDDGVPGTKLYRGVNGLGVANVVAGIPENVTSSFQINGGDVLTLSFNADVTITDIEFGKIHSSDSVDINGLGAPIMFSDATAPATGPGVGGIFSSLSDPAGWMLAANSTFTIGANSGAFFVKSITVESSAVPIPAAAWLFGSALAGIVGLRRRKQ